MGDEQSIENDLSSFSSHLKNLKEVIENITEKSLVLIDEIGAGTDPLEGVSVASAVLEELTKIGCITIATTHHGSLKVFAFETPGVENAAMEFDQKTLSPTYRFKMGLPGSSYAMEMAERLDFPFEVISRAKELRGSEGYSMEKLLVQLQEQAEALSKDLVEAKKERENAAVLAKSYSEKNSELKRAVQEIKSKAIEEAERIVHSANATIEECIRDIRTHEAEKEIVKKAKSNITRLKDELKHLRREFPVEQHPERQFKVGESVRLKGTQSVGEILERIDDERFSVVIGGLKIKVGSTELEHAERDTVHRKSVRPPEIETKANHEVDLRGMYGDDAVSAVERLLDSAMMAGLHRVDIIHGKGTGVLRKRVTEYLKNNPAVKSYRLGEWNEGGSGVTVVELA
jgi:DNA mismatch repair protein MutS2